MKKIISSAVAVCLLLVAVLFFWKANEKDHPYLVVFGSIKSADGIGQQTLGVVRTLKDDLSIQCVLTRSLKEKMPKEIRPYIAKRPDKKAKVYLFEEALWYPDRPEWLTKHIAKMPEDVLKIAYSLFETSRIPAEWVLILNCYFDAVAVSDKFLIDVYRKSGVQIPIFEVPLGIDLERFLNEPLKTRQDHRSMMVFSNLSTCTDRKNHLTLVKAFAKAFENREDVFLKINFREADEATFKLVKEEIDKAGLDNVLMTHVALNSNDYLRLFKSIDCYVSCSKGEGFSIQPREAMALGIPVIATDNTAQSTICESGLVRAVPSPFPEPAYLHCFDKIPYGNFSNCSVDDLAEAMLDVYTNYSAFLEKGNAARKWVEQYRYDRVKGLYLNLVRPKKVVLGDNNLVTEEGLTTDSPELYKKYQKILGQVR